MMLLSDYFAWMATVSTIGLYLTGIQTCNRIFKAGSSSNIAFFPILACTVSCIIWLKYATLIQDRSLIIVNVIGVILESSYAIFYYLHLSNKSVVNRMIFYAMLIVILILTYTKYWIKSHETAMEHLGYVCCSTSIIMYGSPLVSAVKVIRSGSSESMQLSLCMANAVVSFEWSVYGYTIRNRFVLVPNAMGAILSLLQLVVYFKYSGRPTKSEKQIFM